LVVSFNAAIFHVALAGRYPETDFKFCRSIEKIEFR